MKYIILSIAVLFSYCCFGQEVDSASYIKVLGDSINQTITLPTTELVQGSYVIKLRTFRFDEHVSMFPLAVVMVFGTILIIGLLACLYEYITEKK